MSGLIVTAVTRAIAFEIAQGSRFKLAMDRLWFWRLDDRRDHEDWRPSVNTAAINHLLSVHRDSRIGRFGQIPLLLNRGVAALVLRGGCRRAAAPPASAVDQVPASNTTPEIPIVGIRNAPGGK